MIDKQTALKLISDLAKKSVRANECARSHPDAKHSAAEENNAAKRLFEALSNEPISEEEIKHALNG